MTDFASSSSTVHTTSSSKQPRLAMSPSRGLSSKRQSLLLAIATVTVLHLIVYRSTSSLRSLHQQQLSQQLSPFTKRNEHEPETDALINWLSIYNHTSPQHKPLVFTLMIVWLIFLFAFVGICASEFFCPNLSHIASRLGLSESVVSLRSLSQFCHFCTASN